MNKVLATFFFSVFGCFLLTAQIDQIVVELKSKSMGETIYKKIKKEVEAELEKQLDKGEKVVLEELGIDKILKPYQDMKLIPKKLKLHKEVYNVYKSLREKKESGSKITKGSIVAAMAIINADPYVRQIDDASIEAAIKTKDLFTKSAAKVKKMVNELEGIYEQEESQDPREA